MICPHSHETLRRQPHNSSKSESSGKTVANANASGTIKVTPDCGCVNFIIFRINLLTVQYLAKLTSLRTCSCLRNCKLLLHWRRLAPWNGPPTISTSPLPHLLEGFSA